MKLQVCVDCGNVSVDFFRQQEKVDFETGQSYVYDSGCPVCKGKSFIDIEELNK